MTLPMLCCGRCQRKRMCRRTQSSSCWKTFWVDTRQSVRNRHKSRSKDFLTNFFPSHQATLFTSLSVTSPNIPPSARRFKTKSLKSPAMEGEKFRFTTPTTCRTLSRRFTRFYDIHHRPSCHMLQPKTRKSAAMECSRTPSSSLTTSS